MAVHTKMTYIIENQVKNLPPSMLEPATDLFLEN